MSRTYKKNLYRKSKRFDKSCRCHGSCPYCRRGRFYKYIKAILTAEDTKGELYQ